MMGNKTNEARLKCYLRHCGYMTYICRVEECWSLSNVGYGPRTRQVILAHKPLLFTVFFSVTVFSTNREHHSRWVCRFNWCSDRVWFMFHYTRRAMKYPMRARGRVTLKAFPWTLGTSQHRIPVSVFPFQTDAKVIVFLRLVFREKTLSHWLPVSPVAPRPPTVIQSHLSSFQECTSVILS